MIIVSRTTSGYRSDRSKHIRRTAAGVTAHQQTDITIANEEAWIAITEPATVSGNWAMATPSALVAAAS
jgi:hypothetical protein